MILINLNWRYYYFDMTETYLEVWISSLCKNLPASGALAVNIIYSSPSLSLQHTKQQAAKSE
jgi:hypothetical protein